MQYESLCYTSKREVRKMLASSDPELMSKALVGMLYGIRDAVWCLDRLLEHIHHPDH